MGEQKCTWEHVYERDDMRAGVGGEGVWIREVRITQRGR